jgi:hypothetical protein
LCKCTVSSFVGTLLKGSNNQVWYLDAHPWATYWHCLEFKYTENS